MIENNKEIDNESVEELLQNLHQELKHQLIIQQGYIKLLLHEDGYGFVNDKQQEMIQTLADKVERLHIPITIIETWLLEKNKMLNK